MMHIHILYSSQSHHVPPPRSIICDGFFCSHFLAVSTLFWLLLLGMHCIFKQLHPHQNTHSPHHHSDRKPLEVFQGETTGGPGRTRESLGDGGHCASWSPKMLAQVQWKRQHPQFRITCCCEFRKEINESKSQQKGQKTFIWRGFAELFLNLKQKRCHKNISSTSFWPPCGFSKVYNRCIMIHRLVLSWDGSISPLQLYCTWKCGPYMSIFWDLTPHELDNDEQFLGNG